MLLTHQRDHKTKTLNPITILNAAFLTITLSAAIIYYKKIKRIKEEYESKEDVVKSMTLGIAGNIYSNIKNIENTIMKLRADINEALIKSEKALETSETTNQDMEKIFKRMSEIERMLIEVKERIVRKPVKIEAPIPIDDREILDGLNDTELKILMILDELEEGTVPEIKKRINKTREHTARMLKKLYDKGFIDRNTSSIPYRYYLRKEVKEIIRRRAKEAKTLNV